jgi:hypothetical protein
MRALIVTTSTGQLARTLVSYSSTCRPVSTFFFPFPQKARRSQFPVSESACGVATTQVDGDRRCTSVRYAVHTSGYFVSSIQCLFRYSPVSSATTPASRMSSAVGVLRWRPVAAAASKRDKWFRVRVISTSLVNEIGARRMKTAREMRLVTCMLAVSPADVAP